MTNFQDDKNNIEISIQLVQLKYGNKLCLFDLFSYNYMLLDISGYKIYIIYI